MGENRGRYQGKRLISGQKAGRSSRGRRVERADTVRPVREAAPAEVNGQEEILRTAEIRRPEETPQPPVAKPEETAAPRETEKPAAEKPEKARCSFWKDYGYLIITAAVVLLVFRVLLQLAYVPSGSMENTIPRESLLISWQLPYLVSDPDLERGDVVTFWNAEENKLLVKRVIGLPGEEISFSNGYVYVNGEKLEEDYLTQRGVTNGQGRDTYQVPEGCLFMLGDNRTGSKDSRFWNEPFVTTDTVRARVMVCIPLTRWHNIPLPQLGAIHLVG